MTDQNYTESEEFKSVAQTTPPEGGGGIFEIVDKEEFKKDYPDVDDSKDEEKINDGLDISELELPESKEKSKLPGWVEERIKIKNKKIAIKEAEIAELKSKLNQYSNLTPDNYSPSPQSGYSVPSRDAFESDDEWVSAVVEHKLREKEHIAQTTHYQKQQEAAIEAHVNRVNEKISKGERKYEDFEEVTAPLFDVSFPQNQAMTQEVFGSDHAEDLLYFFGKYPDKAREIALLPPQKVIRKIYDLEKRFEAAANSKKSSNKDGYTPNPKIKSSGGSGSDLSWESMANMSQEDYDKAYEKKLSSKKVWS